MFETIRRVGLGLSLVVVAGCSQTSVVTSCSGEGLAPERLFLQQLDHDSVTIRWHGDAQFVCVALIGDKTGVATLATEADGHYSVEVEGLQADTSYEYVVGGAMQSPSRFTFKTAPLPGELPADGVVRLWIVGDSGTAAEVDSDGKLEHEGEAAAVRDGYHRFNETAGGQQTMDLFVQLGDTAYPAGTDQQWQEAFFDIYPEQLRSTMAVPTIGNHGMGYGSFDLCLYQRIPECSDGPVMIQIGGASQSADPMSYDSDGDGADGTGMPYLRIFDLPAEGQIGGVASGTEQYYSMDYATLHLVSLDSQLSTQSQEAISKMRDWLVRDLTSNRLPWTLVIFHHPPYSKAENHDSDREQREIVMRETFAPIFEQYNVDVVFSGHSHSFERSWYLHGHHGHSHTFDADQHTELGADGTPSLGQQSEPYGQISRMTRKDDRVVYTVAGNAGHTTYPRLCAEGQIFGCSRSDWLAHPANRTFPKLADDYGPNGIARIGSVVVDVTDRELTSKLIDAEGNVLDYFIITR